MINNLPPEILEGWQRIPALVRCWFLLRVYAQLARPSRSIRFASIHALAGFGSLLFMPPHPVSIMGAWAVGFITAAVVIK